MKKNILFLALFASFFANAQTYFITGNVVNENKKNLVGATVTIIDLKKSTSTDFDGNYQFELPKGAYTIEVSYLGYETAWQETEVIKKTNTLNFYLYPKSTLLDEVLVSAVRVQVDAPVTHSNLTKKEISKRNLGQDIPILMNYLPSVITSSDAGAGIGYTYIRVRGSDASRVNVTVNGIPYNDAESQGTFWVNMGDFASSTQSLQLQRGVGTSTNGSGAFGASLNILTDAVSEVANGEISNSFGSFGTRKHTVKFSTGKINENFELAGRVSNIYSDGYVERAFSDLKSYFLQGSYTDENTLIKALVFGGKEYTYQAWYGLSASQLKENRRQNPYSYDNETDNYQQDHYQLHWNEKIDENWATNVGLNYTRGKGYFEQFKIGETAKKFNNLIVDNSDVIVQRWLDNHFYVANFTLDYTSEKVKVISGISYSDYKNDHYGELIWGSDLAPKTNINDRYYESNSSKSDISIFSKVTFNVTKKLKAFLDFQGRFINYKTDGLTAKRVPISVNADFSFFNPKLGVTYRINNRNNLYFSYAGANREPNRNNFERGNSKHESLDDIELGWRLNTRKVKLNANVYWMDYKNQLVVTGEIDSNTGEPLRASSGKSNRIGLEIDANILVNKKLSMQPNIAISSNKNIAFFTNRGDKLQQYGNTNIANSPGIVTGNVINYQFSDALQVSFLSKYVGEQYLSNTDTEASKLDSYFTSDFNLIYEIKTAKIFKSIVFTALINNVFNKEYVDRGYIDLDTWSSPNSVSEVQGYYPQATRNFLLGMTLKF